MALGSVTVPPREQWNRGLEESVVDLADEDEERTEKEGAELYRHDILGSELKSEL